MNGHSFFSKEKDPQPTRFYIKTIETMKCGSLLFSVTFINLSIMLTSNESGVNKIFSHFRHYFWKCFHSSFFDVVIAVAPASNALSTSSTVRINPPAKIGTPVRSFTSAITPVKAPGSTSI